LTSSAVVVALRDCAFRHRAACPQAGENHLKPWPSPPDAPREELPVDDEAADDDAAEERAPVAAPAPAAAVRVVGWSPSPRWDRSGSCRPTASESRTTGRGFFGRPAGFAVLGVEALAEGSGVAVVDDSETPAGADDTCLVRVGVSVDVTCLVRVGVLLDVTSGETFAFAVSMAGAARVTGAGMLSSGGKPIRVAALLIPSPIALTRSAATFPGLSVGMSRAGVGSHGGMLRS